MAIIASNCCQESYFDSLFPNWDTYGLHHGHLPIRFFWDLLDTQRSTPTITMSFKINFSPSNVNRDLGSEQVRIFEIETPNSDPDFGKHMNYFSLLCAQSNQISGMKNEIGEYVVTSGYRPFQGNFCGQCNNLSTAHVPEGMQPVTKGFLSDFEASASLGCRICQLILAAVSPYTGPGRLKAYIRPGAALNILVKSVDKNARYDLFTQIGKWHSFP